MTNSGVEIGPALVERRETLVAGPSVALAGLLDINPPVRRDGDTLPAGWHWIYLLEKPRQDDLGPDGHSLYGIPAPPGRGPVCSGCLPAGKSPP